MVLKTIERASRNIDLQMSIKPFWIEQAGAEPHRDNAVRLRRDGMKVAFGELGRSKFTRSRSHGR